MEVETISSEEDAQKAYEDFVKETNPSLETESKEIINKTEDKFKAGSGLVETQANLESTVLELEQLSNYSVEPCQSEDFVLKHFGVRRTTRDEEIYNKMAC
eukprot:16443466-Heterocapsa_arctica.AAC.1